MTGERRAQFAVAAALVAVAVAAFLAGLHADQVWPGTIVAVVALVAVLVLTQDRRGAA